MQECVACLLSMGCNLLSVGYKGSLGCYNNARNKQYKAEDHLTLSVRKLLHMVLLLFDSTFARDRKVVLYTVELTNFAINTGLGAL